MKPLRYSQQQIEEEDIAAVVRVLRSPYLTQGPEIEAFEAALAAYVGAKYAICVGSGTAALHLAYLATRANRIITSPLSFVATANAALLADVAGIRFLDVNAATGLLDPALGLLDPAEYWVPVHYAGRACQIPYFDGVRTPVIEDACHALGAMDFDGCSKVGSCAHSLATVFSFHPVKPITTGEGGAITTNYAALAATLRKLRSHGRDENGQMIALGYNYRMTEMQAALGRSQLTRIEDSRASRCALASIYCAYLPPSDDVLGQHGIPWDDCDDETCRLSHHLFPVRIGHGRRDTVKATLNAQGIGAQVHYPPIHLQPYYRERFGYKEGDFPEAEAWGREELSLPLHAGMRESDVDRVCKALKEALS